MSKSKKPLVPVTQNYEEKMREQLQGKPVNEDEWSWDSAGEKQASQKQSSDFFDWTGEETKSS